MPQPFVLRPGKTVPIRAKAKTLEQALKAKVNSLYIKLENPPPDIWERVLHMRSYGDRLIKGGRSRG